MTITIRDYIYVDLSRLRSIYAQFNGGLVEQFIKSESTSESTRHNENRKSSELGKEAILGATRLEARVLHDYIFSEVEKFMSDFIVDIQEDGVENVASGSFIKVRGLVEIDDSERLIHIAENFNKLEAGIRIAGMADDVQKKIWELEDQLAKTIHQKDREKIENEIREWEPESILRRLRIGVPRLTIQMLKNWINLLYNGIFEIRVRPTNMSNGVFRAILNRQDIRENPQMLYAKYGSRTQVEWTLVGQVTTIIEPEKIGQEDSSHNKALRELLGNTTESSTLEKVESNEVSDSQSELPEAELPSNIRDSIENIFDAIFAIEKFLLISAHQKSWVVTPLAIYHEVIAKK